MDYKLKFFWNLDVLVKMCRSKSDGPSLRIEEDELENEISEYKKDIEEIKILIEEESYDTSAEMADRNIEIITKKQIQSLRQILKEKNKILEEIKDEEKKLYDNTALLREKKEGYDKYISSMQERINEATQYEIIDRYNSLIAETTEKIGLLNQELEKENIDYKEIQKNIVELTKEIAGIEDKIDNKSKLLSETQANLENKDNYIDKTKKDKNNKKIIELETKIQRLEKRLEEIRKDPKYLENKIKDIVNNNEDISNTKKYLISLLNVVIRQPYINIKANNELEEELLRATQARDNFANQVDQKNYNILNADTPEKIRINFLTTRIEKWEQELLELNEKVEKIDNDQEYDYENKDKLLNEMISVMKVDLEEYQKAYNDTPDVNIGVKASLKVSLDEKSQDIIEAEKIAMAFRKDESEDIVNATRLLKFEGEQLKLNIKNAKTEIHDIKDRLISKKSGAIDITSKNRDKEILKELAQTVIDLKHRRQFVETPLEILERLEKELNLELINNIDREFIENSSKIEHKNYDEFIKRVEDNILKEADVTEELPEVEEQKKGVKVITEAKIVPITVETTDNEESSPTIEEISKIDTDNDSINESSNEVQKEVVEELEEIGKFISEDDKSEPRIEEETDNEKETIEIIESVTEPEILDNKSEVEEEISQTETNELDSDIDINFDDESKLEISENEKLENESVILETTIPEIDTEVQEIEEVVEDNETSVSEEVSEFEIMEPQNHIINDDSPLDIASIVESVQHKEENNLTLNAIFNNESNEISIEQLEDELENHLNNLNEN